MKRFRTFIASTRGYVGYCFILFLKKWSSSNYGRIVEFASAAATFSYSSQFDYIDSQGDTFLFYTSPAQVSRRQISPLFTSSHPRFVAYSASYPQYPPSGRFVNDSRHPRFSRIHFSLTRTHTSRARENLEGCTSESSSARNSPRGRHVFVGDSQIGARGPPGVFRGKFAGFSFF